MKKIISSLLVLALMLAFCPMSALAAESNVWEYIGSAPVEESSSNIWQAYDPAAAVQVTSPDLSGVTESSVIPAAASSSNIGKVTTVENEAGKLPSALQGVLTESTYTMPYAVKVDLTNQVITVFTASESGVYNVIAKQFICSTGTSKYPTPTGVYTLPDTSRRDWRLFKTYNTYVRYAVHIEGNYFFHSLLYNKMDLSTLSRTSYRKLGTPASHGCIRMLDEDVKWMFENCLAGTRIFIMDCEKDSALNKSLLPPKL